MKTAAQLAEEGWIRWSESRPAPWLVIQLFNPEWPYPITTVHVRVPRECRSARNLWWRLTGIGRWQHEQWMADLNRDTKQEGSTN